MNIYKHLKLADEMSLSKGFAIQARKRYLKDLVDVNKAECAELFDWIDGYGDVNEFYAINRIGLLLQDRDKLRKEYRKCLEILKPRQGDITEQMIENAREYPVENLLDFRRGKTYAFCHEDKQPSLYHATRTNRANCPVCDKTFDSIGILMARDGLDFIQAVKQLQ